MYLENGQLKPIDHTVAGTAHANDIIPSFTLGNILVRGAQLRRGRDGRDRGRVAWCPRSSGTSYPRSSASRSSTTESSRAHFGYRNSGGALSLPQATPWNSFSPEPADRGQGTLFGAGEHVDHVQVEFKAGRKHNSLTLGTTTVSASRDASETRRCQASITVAQEAECTDWQLQPPDRRRDRRDRRQRRRPGHYGLGFRQGSAGRHHASDRRDRRWRHQSWRTTRSRSAASGRTGPAEQQAANTN